MVNQIYPSLEINLGYITDNMSKIVKMCKAEGIDVMGVTKGTTGLPQCAKAFEAGGAKFIASSRLEQLEESRDFGIALPHALIRVPMLSEVPEVVRLADISLNSDTLVLQSLNTEAKRQEKIHKVILMADLGDLREGFWDKDEMIKAAITVENDMDNLYLLGIGTNLGCYGSLEVTVGKMDDLIALAEKVEENIGRTLEYISGGSSRALARILDKDMPKRINLLRIGEAALLARDLQLYQGYDMSFLHKDAYTLKAEIIEIREKPTYPQGTISVDAFGHKPEYIDRGVRRRALLGVGKVDYGTINDIFPKDSKISIVGASSDHTIIDVEDADKNLKTGSIVEFKINYGAMVYLTNCKNVRITFK